MLILTLFDLCANMRGRLVTKKKRKFLLLLYMSSLGHVYLPKERKRSVWVKQWLSRRNSKSVVVAVVVVVVIVVVVVVVVVAASMQ